MQIDDKSKGYPEGSPDIPNTPGTKDTVARNQTEQTHGALTSLTRDNRMEIYSHLGPHLLPARLLSKPFRKEIDDYRAMTGGSLALKHPIQQRMAIDSFLCTRNEQTRSGLSASGAHTAEATSVLVQAPEQRSVEALVECKLLPANMLNVALSKGHRDFLCSDKTVRALYWRNDKDRNVDVSLIAAVPEQRLSPHSMKNAILAGEKDIVTAMIRCGLFDVNESNMFGLTPLYTAVLKEDLDIAALLIEHGADPECKALDSGSSPIDLAKAQDADDMLRLLNSGRPQSS